MVSNQKSVLIHPWNAPDKPRCSQRSYSGLLNSAYTKQSFGLQIESKTVLIAQDDGIKL